MPIIIADPADNPGQTKQALHVWRSEGTPNEYALCANPHYPDFQTRDWLYLGDLLSVEALASFPRLTIDNGTVGGWPFRVQVLGKDKYLF